MALQQINHLLSWTISRQNSRSATNWFIFTMLIPQITALMFTFSHPSLQMTLWPLMSGHSRRPVAATSLYDKMPRVLLSKLKSLQRDAGTSCSFKSLCVCASLCSRTRPKTQAFLRPALFPTTSFSNPGLNNQTFSNRTLIQSNS